MQAKLFVTDMDGTFSSCESLVSITSIPAGVTSMMGTFYQCKSLQAAPEIPAGVTNIESLFWKCYALTGNVVINANPSEYKYCFYDVNMTKQGIYLIGDSTILSKILETASDD